MLREEKVIIAASITQTSSDQKSKHLAKAADFYGRAKELIEVDQDWQACGSMILKALAEERKPACVAETIGIYYFDEETDEADAGSIAETA